MDFYEQISQFLNGIHAKMPAAHSIDLPGYLGRQLSIAKATTRAAGQNIPFKIEIQHELNEAMANDERFCASLGEALNEVIKYVAQVRKGRKEICVILCFDQVELYFSDIGQPFTSIKIPAELQDKRYRSILQFE